MVNYNICKYAESGGSKLGMSSEMRLPADW